ncbi:NAD(P)H-binding protein [Streptomyces siamensis]|uniref:NAD(P)-binding domain-containing protein n=1 Tax=Streptomyces siamensis TaxID=1274986 RepID=A0ABP9IYV3_9ACTN
MKSPIAVIGGAGSVARLVTRELMARGETIRVIGRSTLRAHRHLPPLAQYFLADLRRPETLRTPLHGCGAVVYAVEPGPDAPGDSMEAGVVNTLDVLRSGAVPGKPRFVLLSRADEAAVRASGLPCTVVRPGRLTEQDLAEACVEAVYRPTV